MKDYKELESLINKALRRYEEVFNQVNSEQEIRFVTTMNQMQVEVQGVKKWVEYLRCQRDIRPKGSTEDEWESLLIYNQAYKFENIKERLNATAPWKYELYEDMMYRLLAGGLEYSELMKRMKQTAQEKAGQPLAEISKPKLDLEITDQMPEPLTDGDKKYVEWVKNNAERA